jgi:hypothetical protein
MLDFNGALLPLGSAAQLSAGGIWAVTPTYPGGSGSTACVVTGDQHVHFATALHSGSNGIEGGGLDARVIVFSNDERSHGKSW